MPEDERLREALTELRSDLERAHRSASEAEAILRLSEALADVQDRQRALDLLVEKTASIFGVSSALVIEGAAPDYAVCASADDTSGGYAFPLSLTDKVRNYTDLHALPVFDSQGAPQYRSLLSAPLSVGGDAQAALLCQHADAKFFGRSDVALIRRIVRFASQTRTRIDLSGQTRLLSAVIDGSSSGFAIANARSTDRP